VIYIALIKRGGSLRASSRKKAGYVLLPIISISLPFKYRQLTRPSHYRQTTFQPQTYSNYSAISYQLRKCTRVTNTKLTLLNTASSVTLEHTKPTTDRTMLRKRLKSRKPKRRLNIINRLFKKSTRVFQLLLARNTILIRVRIAKRGL